MNILKILIQRGEMFEVFSYWRLAFGEISSWNTYG
jgi:hypothetical protein